MVQTSVQYFCKFMDYTIRENPNEYKILSGAYWIIPKVHLAWNSEEMQISKRDYKNWFKHGEDASLTHCPSLLLLRDFPSLQRFLKTVSKFPLNFLSIQEGPEVFWKADFTKEVHQSLTHYNDTLNTL